MTTLTARPFEIRSADGTTLHGQVDMPAEPTGVAVIFASGSGLFDRDMVYGQTGTPRDRVFKDLGERLVARGAMAVRHDRRGVRFPMTSPADIDSRLTVTTTTSVQVEDLRAIYDWTRSPEGLGARRIVFFAHSEGMLHVGRLASDGAPAPAAVIGMGALMESPKAVLHWQMAERDALSILAMDVDGDGIVTNDEVRAKWESTPAALSALDTLLSPTGHWTGAELEALKARQHAAWEEAARKAAAAADAAPFPEGGEVVAGPYQWWKSWFTDDMPNAERLAAWSTHFSLHYGTIDSQTDATRQQAAARAALPASRLQIAVHPGVGHGLGGHPAIGPINEPIAERIADEAAALR